MYNLNEYGHGHVKIVAKPRKRKRILECENWEGTWWYHQKEEVALRWTLMVEDERLARHYVSYKESVRQETETETERVELSRTYRVAIQVCSSPNPKVCMDRIRVVCTFNPCFYRIIYIIFICINLFKKLK